MNIFLFLALILFLLWFIYNAFVIYHGGFDKCFDKFYKATPVCPEWDAKVHNWLTEDHLKFSLPSYVFWKGEGVIHSIETPIGEIWICNYPYAFGQKCSLENRVGLTNLN